MPIEVCWDRLLSDVKYMPANGGAGGQRIALLKAKLWPAGSQIKVKFAASATPAQKKYTQESWEQWAAWANLDFKLANAGPSEVRITYDAGGGAWSYLGTDCLGIAQNKATMNLGFGGLGTALHEFGHTLGAIHEHQSPFGGIKWAKEQVYRDLSGPPNNWDRATIDNNLFAAYSKSQLNGSEFDPLSIMLYAIPKSWTLDGFQSNGNRELSDRDKQWAAKCYPGRGTITPEPEPILVPVFDLEPTGESLTKAGERDLFQFEVGKSGRHRIEAVSKNSLVLHVFGPNSRTLLVAKTDNAGVDFNCRLEAPLTPGTYYAQVAGADDTVRGKYSLMILRLAEGVEFDEQAVIWRGRLLDGSYNLIRR